MTSGSASEDQMVKVTFNIEGDPWHQHSSESLWAKALGGGRFRLENVPFFVKGFGYGDVIEASEGLTGLEYRDVVERGGHSTLRVVSQSSDELEVLADRLRAMQCECEIGDVGSTTILAVCVAPDVNNDAVVEVLEIGRASGTWDWEVGFDATDHEGPHA